MNKRLILGIIVILSIGVILWFMPISTKKITQPQPSADISPTARVTVEIQITAQGFKPAVIVMPKDAEVIWINADEKSHQVASNPHPAHTEFPDLVSPILQPSQSYVFRFAHSGTFGYHDELNLVSGGAVIVQE